MVATVIALLVVFGMPGAATVSCKPSTARLATLAVKMASMAAVALQLAAYQLSVAMASSNHQRPAMTELMMDPTEDAHRIANMRPTAATGSRMVPNNATTVQPMPRSITLRTAVAW